jgi:hypothetical protein
MLGSSTAEIRKDLPVCQALFSASLYFFLLKLFENQNLAMRQLLLIASYYIPMSCGGWFAIVQAIVLQQVQLKTHILLHTAQASKPAPHEILIL